MPTIFRIQCLTCGAAPTSAGGVVAYVVFDGQKDGVILPEGYLALRRNDGELVCLPHPVEGLRLKAEGFTRKEAFRQRRLFDVTFKVCTSCGTLHEEVQYREDPAGYLAGLVLGALVFVGLKWGADLPWIAAFLGALLGMIAGAALASLLHRPRWKKEANEEMRIKQCRKCGQSKFVTFYEACDKPLPCPECGGASMQYSIAGKS